MRVDKIALLKTLATDRSAQLLVVSNIINIILALLQKWDLGTILVVFWFQSICIGIFTVIRIMRKEGVMRIDEMAVPISSNASWWTKIITSGFFTMHYGFMHLVYFIFIVALFSKSVNWVEAAYGAALFLGNHLYSFFAHKHEKREDLLSIWTSMMRPYSRIAPMHITILIYGFLSLQVGLDGTIPLLVFLAVKTYADLRAHYLEHSVFPDVMGNVKNKIYEHIAKSKNNSV